MKKVIFLLITLILFVACGSESYEKEQFLGEWKYTLQDTLTDDGKYKVGFTSIRTYNSNNTYSTLGAIQIATVDEKKRLLVGIRSSGEWDIDGDELTINNKKFKFQSITDIDSDKDMKELMEELKSYSEDTKDIDKISYVDESKIIVVVDDESSMVWRKVK